MCPAAAFFAAYTITAYSQTFGDVPFDRYVRPAARVISRQAAARCLSGPQALVSVAASLALDKPIYAVDPATGALGQRLESELFKFLQVNTSHGRCPWLSARRAVRTPAFTDI